MAASTKYIGQQLRNGKAATENGKPATEKDGWKRNSTTAHI
jgi:hypothetical protein